MKSLFITGIITLISTLAFSQAVPDSAAILKRTQKIAAIEKRLADNRVKLESLEKSLAQKDEALDNSLIQSQSSANKNQDAADVLQDNAESKQASRRAAKAAKQAQRDAKRARKASSRKTGIEKDIKKLEKKIEKDDRELQKLQTAVMDPVS